MPGVVIRGFEPDDIDAINALFNQPSVAEMTLQIPYASMAERQERFAPSESTRYVVAEIDGVVVGQAGLSFSRRRMAHVGGLGMAVHAQYQGQGIGRALMDALIDLADNWYNLRRLELHVFTDNERAIGLYRKYGFVVEGTHRAFAYRNGHYADAYSMARLRNDAPINPYSDESD